MNRLSLLPAYIFLISWQGFAQTEENSGTHYPGNDESTFPEASVPVKDVTQGIVSSRVKIGKENHIHTMSINNKPCATVRDGTRLVIECWDALGGKSKEYFDNKTPYAEIFPIANPATGPVFIEGAMPGDALEIEIHDIRLSGNGFIQLNKNQFIENTKREDVYIETKVEGNQMLYNGLKVPVQSMIGTIGTAGLKEIRCQENGDNGGNMDTRIIRQGSKVLLPVFTEGALLAIGDIHAVMGDGEVFGQGVEIGAEVEITVRVRKDLKIQRPMIILADRIACVSSNVDLMAAKNQVVSDMGKFLVNMCGFSSIDASSLIAFYGNLIFCQVVNPQKTIRMEIEKKYIKLFSNKILPF